MELYIHIPFCIKKCAYCDFLSFDSCFEKTESYISALKKDIKESAKECAKPLRSIFIGGGTPSVIDASYIKEIMNTVRDNYSLQPDCEVSIEVNPCSVTAEKLKVYKEAGINRISMGVQSFNDKTLKTLGRAHSSKTAEDAIKLIKNEFSNFSLDLISCVPGESKAEFYESLEKACAAGPKHISVYQLIIEEGTKFYDEYGPLSGYISDLDEEAIVYAETIEKLENKGYRQYEISNFAREGYESIHNTGYWELVPYIGCGLGATGYFNGKRVVKSRDIDEYIKEPILSGYMDDISLEDQKYEYIMMGMRMNKGISKNAYEKRFGESISEEVIRVFKKYTPEFITENNDIFAFTLKGRLVSNTILSEIM